MPSPSDTPLDNLSQFSMESVILYKLGSIESQVRDLNKAIDLRMDTLEANQHELINDVSKQKDSHETRITKLEKTYDTVRNRLIAITTAGGLAWVVFGDYIKSVVGKIL